MIRFLKAREITGLEVVASDSYSRVIELDWQLDGILITITHAPQQSGRMSRGRAICATVVNARLSSIITRIRRMFERLSGDRRNRRRKIASALSSAMIRMLARLVKQHVPACVRSGWLGWI